MGEYGIDEPGMLLTPPPCPCVSSLSHHEVTTMLALKKKEGKDAITQCALCAAASLPSSKSGGTKVPKGKGKSGKSSAPITRATHMCLTCCSALCEKHTSNHFYDKRHHRSNAGGKGKSGKRGVHCVMLCYGGDMADASVVHAHCCHCDLPIGNGLLPDPDHGGYVDGVPTDTQGYALDEGGELGATLERIAAVVKAAAGGAFPTTQPKNFAEAQNRSERKREKSEKLMEVAGYGVKGLRNLGNTCFFNAVMQVLNQVNPLTESVITEVRSSRQDARIGPLMTAVAAFFLSCRAADGKAMAPHVLHGLVCRLNPEFSGFGQHDAQEYLDFLLNALATEFSLQNQQAGLRPRYCPVGDVVGGALETSFLCHGCGTVRVRKESFKDLSVPICKASRTLQGCLLQFFQPVELSGDNAYVCDTCDRDAYEQQEALKRQQREEAQRRAAEAAADAQNPSSLDELVNADQTCPSDSDTEEEGEEAEEDSSTQNAPTPVPRAAVQSTAPTSSSRTTATMQCTLDTAKKVILVHVKRFTVDMECMEWVKDNTAVAFPKVLDLKHFFKEPVATREVAQLQALFGDIPATTLSSLLEVCEQDVERATAMIVEGVQLPGMGSGSPDHTNGGTQYSLAGLVEHRGSVHGGHYVAYVHHANSGKWMECNDSVVDVVSEEAVMRRQAYVLAYVQQ